MNEKSLAVRAKNHLQRVKQLDARVRSLTRKYNAMVASRTFYKPILLTGMPGGGNADSMAASDEMLDMRAELNKLQRDLDVTQIKTRNEIMALEEPFSSILRLRYLHGMSIQQISVAINYSYTDTSRMHTVALHIYAAKYL